MNFYSPSLNRPPQKLFIPGDTRDEIVRNARYFEFQTMDVFAGIFDKTFDVASFFDHDNGQRYCVVHTIFGADYRNIFEGKMIHSDWRISFGSAAHKRDCIKEFICDNACSDKIVYNISESMDGEESDD